MPIARDYRVLLASSDSATRLELARSLVANYELVEASEGADVLVKLETCRPDIAVIDTDVGGLDGFDVCRAIRQDSEFGTMPVFLLSRLDSRADFKRGYDAGATLYMVKPVDAARLLKNIGLTIQSEQIFARPGRADLAQLEARGVPVTPRGGRPVLRESIPIMTTDAPSAASPSAHSSHTAPHAAHPGVFSPGDRRGARAGRGSGASDAGLDRFLGRKGRAFLEPNPPSDSLDQFLVRETSSGGATPKTGFDFLDEPAGGRSEVKTGFDFLDEIEAPAPVSAPPPAAKAAPDLDFLDDLDEPEAFGGLDDLDVPERAGVAHARESVPRAPTPPPYRPTPPRDRRAPVSERREREHPGAPPGGGFRTGEPPREERRRWAERPAASTGDHPDLSFLDEPDVPPQSVPSLASPVRTSPLAGKKEVDLSFLDVPDEVEVAAPSPVAEATHPPPLLFDEPPAAETLRSTHRSRERDRPITVADIMGLDGLDLERTAPAPEPGPSLTDVLGIPASPASVAERPAHAPPSFEPFEVRPRDPGPLPSMSADAMASVDLDDILGPATRPPASDSSRLTEGSKSPPDSIRAVAFESAFGESVVEPSPEVGASASNLDASSAPPGASAFEPLAPASPEPPSSIPPAAPAEEAAPSIPEPPATEALAPVVEPPPPPPPPAAAPASKLPPPPVPGAVGPDGKRKSLNLRQLLGEPGKGKPGLPPPPQARPRPAGAGPGAPAARPSAIDSKILGLGAPGGDSAPDA